MVNTMNKFENSQLVKTVDGDIVTVIKQSGIMVETSIGRFHHSKLIKVEMPDGVFTNEVDSRDDVQTENVIETTNDEETTERTDSANELNSSKRVTKRSIAETIYAVNATLNKNELIDLFVKVLEVKRPNAAVYYDYVTKTGRYANGKK